MDGENYYDDGPAQQPSAAPQDKEDKGEAQTALLPKAFFQGKDLQPGTRCEVEITQVHDEEVSVKYVEHDESKEAPEPGEEQSPPPSAPGDMASMME